MRVYIVLEFKGKDTRVHSLFQDQTDAIYAVAHLGIYSNKHKLKTTYDYIVKTAKTNLKRLIKTSGISNEK